MAYLTSTIAFQVPEHVRDRGRAYHRQRRVRDLVSHGSVVAAKVVGSSEYAVEILRDEDGLGVVCNCPYFSRGEICKHIWATALAAEERGYLRPDHQHGHAPRKPSPAWSRQLDHIRDAGHQQQSKLVWPHGRQLLYLISRNAYSEQGGLLIDVVTQDTKSDGTSAKPKVLRLSRKMISSIPDPIDRQVLVVLAGTQTKWASSYDYYSDYGNGVILSKVELPSAFVQQLIPMMCTTGRAAFRGDETSAPTTPLRIDEGAPWELRLEAARSRDQYEISARLQRGEESMDLDKPEFIEDGLIFMGDGTVGSLEGSTPSGWVSMMRSMRSITLPESEVSEFLSALADMPSLPPLDFPDELTWAERVSDPRPRLSITRRSKAWGRGETLLGTLIFDYEGASVAHDDPRSGIFDHSNRTLLRRDPDAEAAALEILTSIGFKPSVHDGLEINPKHLSRVVRTLVASGWYVEAEGMSYRSATSIDMRVSSGIDWFELEGGASFEGQTVSLPDLLAAIRKKDPFVRLGDGSFGLLPEEWLESYGLLAGIGTGQGEVVRFNRNQGVVLDVLLAAQPEVDIDETFARWRQRIDTFEGVEATEPPAGFRGELRGYQKEGLGWLLFHQGFGSGGCLADDMGLGKTVQVLALLEFQRAKRRRSKSNGRPSLVVVPKSLVTNWVKEAERFTPKLKVLMHTDSRLPPGDHFDDFDMIITTYGTLRRDITQIAQIRFDYCILDEAQAIKNASTASAKAARLIQADHRLAMSGTPIENHLGELWSLFEFLNPGMLGAASWFDATSRTIEGPGRELLSQALRPFILRRTKEQVASDLPPKTEETIWCDLGPAQRKHYNQLRDHYRKDILTKVDRDGIAKSKVMILEALLRLRQAACHPGLIDEKRNAEDSAKLDVLIPHLMEIAEEGHRALVFSQFTKLLAIVRARLDEQGFTYEYLDGRTRDRQLRVDRFQDDRSIKAFLISLKAGGVGLNLTGADYVFLLDPWWNPAVEAQAIDRTHRIGQTAPVFAYRIVARDTVEEKVLELQSTKRSLADAIITADNSVLRRIERDDLELLLS